MNVGRCIRSLPRKTISRQRSLSTHLDFNDSQTSFGTKSNRNLIRALLVFGACKSSILVQNATSLIQASRRLLGSYVTNHLLRYTFFGHFCAGETPTDIRPTVKHLEENGIGSILDYCAEADIEESAELKADVEVKVAQQCRIYSYTDEKLCDIHAKTFEDCIRAVHAVSPTGFAAIKITALGMFKLHVHALLVMTILKLVNVDASGNPVLLERMSTALVELQNFFKKIDTAKTGRLTKKAFIEGFNSNFVGLDAEEEFLKMDENNCGSIGYMEWSKSIPLERLHLLTSKCKEKGPLALATLNDEERQLMEALERRADYLANLAMQLGVRLMIDAEHTYFQPAIDSITTKLARKYNLKYPVVFNTYQMYLKNALQRLRYDIQASERVGYHFAAKIVRGAYMTLERKRALELGYEDPIFDTIEGTHESYNLAVADCIEYIAEGKQIEVMVASHNQDSIERAIATLEKYNLGPTTKIYFGQLLGMSDNLSYTLGRNGFKAYKYVPYGKVDEVIPYLLRRAQENSGMLGGATKEIEMIIKEFRRRRFLL